MSPSFVASRSRITTSLLLFGSAIFLSAWLLFQLQPMFAKMALPLLGGAPAVWNAALVFFQAVLLLGYLYAHFIGTRLGLKSQVIVHIGVLAAAFVFLPIAIGPGWRHPPETMPLPWLIALFASSVGAPFFALSATSPLLQRWFTGTGGMAARDPYFLYAASNLGSLLALIAYPLLVEPEFALAEQSVLWAFGYAILALTIGAGGCFALQAQRRRRESGADPIEQPSHRVLGAPDWQTRFLWLALAFVPAGMLVSGTTLITTDLVAVPLLWTIPLVLYFLTFVLVFARRTLLPERWLAVAQAPLLAIAALVATWNLADHLYAVIGLTLATLFTTSMVCHGGLARRRPPTRYLTEFYVWMSLGGILGSAFSALVAPLAFDMVIEFPILCAAAALLRPRTDYTDEKRAPTLAVTATTILREISFPVLGLSTVLLLAPRLEEPGQGATALILFALVVIFTIVFTILSAGRPLRFALCVSVLAIFGVQLTSNVSASNVHRERSFFGTHLIKRDKAGEYLLLAQGNTVHGVQPLAPSRHRERNSYYHAGSGVGRLYAAFEAKRTWPGRVGVLGLGAGEISCYRRDGQDWTFYEIDPAVVRIARGGRWFHFLGECAPDAHIVLGDGRLGIAREPKERFDLIVLDAFASDSIPVHLITREAFRTYLDKLAPGGLILLNISNRYLDLEPVVADLAADSSLSARVFDTRHGRTEPNFPFRFRSMWIAFARDEARLRALTDEFDRTAPSAWGQWRRLARRAGTRLWTDDYSNILAVLK